MSPTRQVLAKLLHERGIVRFALFLTQQEGTMLTDDVESLSGFVIDERGRVFRFWLNRSAPEGDFVLDRFTRVYAPSRAFSDDPEYREARAELGLDST